MAVAAAASGSAACWESGCPSAEVASAAAEAAAEVALAAAEVALAAVEIALAAASAVAAARAVVAVQALRRNTTFPSLSKAWQELRARLYIVRTRRRQGYRNAHI